MFLPITPEAIQESLDINGKMDFVCITTPTYEGLSADIESIAKICHDRDIKLIIDSAHGSLFYFDSRFPCSGLGIQGVDVVVQSLHKGAGSLAQTSIIHLNKGSKIKDA